MSFAGGPCAYPWLNKAPRLLPRYQQDSNVEMNWRVFGGRYADLYMALLKERCVRDGLGTDPDVLAQQSRLHLHRGIAYLSANKELRKIEDLVSLALKTA